MDIKIKAGKKGLEDTIVYIPEKLNPKELELGGFMQNYDLFKRHPPTFSPFVMDKFFYIISLPMCLPVTSQKLISSDDEYISINSLILKKVIPDYNKYISYALNAGVLETDGRYITSQKAKQKGIEPKSKGYRISERFLGEMTPLRIKVNLVQPELNNDSFYLTKWFNNELQIDYKEAIKYINSSENNFSSRKKAYYTISVKRIYIQDYFYSFDSTVNRFYSNVVNLKKEFRKFLSYGGRSLVEVDLKNSQPYFSLFLLNYFWKHNGGKKKERGVEEGGVGNEEEKGKRERGYLDVFDSIFDSKEIDELAGFINSIIAEPDVHDYINLVESGKLYDHLRVEFQKEGIYFKSRQEVKGIVFTTFFSGNQFMGQEEANTKKIFSNLFPNVYGVFRMIKKRKKNRLAILLQSIESYFFLEVICKRISHERPNLPIYTIHDSILTLEGEEEYVAETICRSLSSAIGIKPKTEVTYYNESNERAFA